ncbi:MAG: permease, partial [Patescibacteria group bacterium]|nr:permease [Patescibacteria group bacterium]
KMLVAHLGSSKKVRGWIIAIVSGVISSGPIYMWFPLLSDLKEKGVKDTFLTTFLYSRAVKIPLLPVMVYYFGTTFTAVLTGYILLFSIINGLVVSNILKEKGVKKV